MPPGTVGLGSGGRGFRSRAGFAAVEFPRGGIDRFRSGGNRRLRAHRLHHFLDLLAVVEADHHHHEFRLLGRDHLLGRHGPIGIFAAGVVPHLGADQAGRGAVPPQDADFRGVGEGLLEAIGEPVRHRIAEHHDRRLRHRVGLLGRGGLGKVRRRRAILPLGGIEPAAAAVPAEERKPVIEQLSAGRRRRDHQQRRHRRHFRGDQDDGGKQPHDNQPHNNATGHSISLCDQSQVA